MKEVKTIRGENFHMEAFHLLLQTQYSTLSLSKLVFSLFKIGIRGGQLLQTQDGVSSKLEKGLKGSSLPFSHMQLFLAIFQLLESNHGMMGAPPKKINN